jgi:hypothetical protein
MYPCSDNIFLKFVIVVNDVLWLQLVIAYCPGNCRVNAVTASINGFVMSNANPPERRVSFSMISNVPYPSLHVYVLVNQGAYNSYYQCKTWPSFLSNRKQCM